MTETLKETIARLFRSAYEEDHLLACTLLESNTVNLREEIIALFERYGEKGEFGTSPIYLCRRWFPKPVDTIRNLTHIIHSMRDNVIVLAAASSGSILLLDGNVWHTPNGFKTVKITL